MSNDQPLFDLCNSFSATHQQLCCDSDLQKISTVNHQYDIQFLHQKLYPILFQYIDRFIRDEEISDALIADLFFEMIKNDKLNGDLMTIIVFALQNARKNCINNSNKRPDFFEFSSEDFDEMTEVNLLHLNTMSSSAREVVFLKYALGLDWSKISKITNIPGEYLNRVFREINLH